jgi:predicted Rossmann-fold nucleotide-binding protein
MNTKRKCVACIGSEKLVDSDSQTIGYLVGFYLAHTGWLIKTSGRVGFEQAVAQGALEAVQTFINSGK